jgi:hypothetical protein
MFPNNHLFYVFSAMMEVKEMGIRRLGGGRSMSASQLAVGANAKLVLDKPATAARFET